MAWQGMKYEIHVLVLNLSARIKESKPEDPELEASKTSQLIKHEKENDFDVRKKAKCVS